MENAPEQNDVVSQAPAAPERSAPLPRLEDRIQRLEDAVALLAHQVRWEDLDQEGRNQEPVARIKQEADLFSTTRLRGEEPEVSGATEDKPIPRATPIPPPAASLAEFAIPHYAEPLKERPSALSNMLKPIQTALPVASSVMNKVLPPSSIFRDLWWDIRIVWRMLRDRTYPMTTACKVFPLFAIFYVTIWPYLSAWSGLLGTVMNYFVNAIVIYVAFKVVQRELRRYYDFAEKYRR